VLFGERPKTNRSDLFGRERELNELKEKIDKPLLLLTGIRRIGKTFMLNLFLNESKPFLS
jgi:Archaeal ATPase.